jgi:hypothetical protein
MASVTQYTNYFCGQSFVQKLDHCFAVSAVALGYGAVLYVFSRAIAQSLDISEKWLLSRGLTPRFLNLGVRGY